MSNRVALPLKPGSRGPRHKVFLPAEMATAAGTTRIHLLNLSLTGALIHGEPAPRAGAVVQLRCGDVAWPARVVWAQHSRFGVLHVTPLAPGIVAALVAGA